MKYEDENANVCLISFSFMSNSRTRGGEICSIDEEASKKTCTAPETEDPWIPLTLDQVMHHNI